MTFVIVINMILFDNLQAHTIIIIKMFPVIDFRNGRYQGQTKQQLPHGVGCFMDNNFMFCIGEWIAGEVVGKTIIIFPSGRIFCGKILYRDMDGVCSFELVQDHVQLVTRRNSNKKQREMEKMAALLPLLKIILDIDNSDPENGKVLAQYQYSDKNQRQNLNAVCKILKQDRNVQKLYQFSCFLRYFEDSFYKFYPNVFQFMITGNKNKQQFFIGLKGEGLGVKIQPNEQLGLNKKKTGRVYMIRGMGYFTKQNALKDLGLKMKDNPMKGVVYQQGVFSSPNTLISYQNGKRPINCNANFHKYIKRSLFYRDKVLYTQYLYHLQSFVYAFNENLRKIETQKVAQQTIQRPNSEGYNLAQIQRLRRSRPIQNQMQQPQIKINNPYHPTNQIDNISIKNPQYNNLHLAKDDIYRSANKKRYVPQVALDQYKKSQYIDPNYMKIQPRDYKYNNLREPYLYNDFPQDYQRRQPSRRINRNRPNYDQYEIPIQPQPRRQRILPTRTDNPYRKAQYPTSNYPSTSPSRKKSPLQNRYNRQDYVPQYRSPTKYDYYNDDIYDEYPYRYSPRKR